MSCLNSFKRGWDRWQSAVGVTVVWVPLHPILVRKRKGGLPQWSSG